MTNALVKTWAAFLVCVVLGAISTGCAALWSAASAFQGGYLAVYDLGVVVKCSVVVTVARCLIAVTDRIVNGE